MGALLDIEAFRAAAKGGEAPDATLLKYADSEPSIVAGASARTRRFTFSTADVDHANDVIKQEGWDLSVFRRNPVALFAHNSSALPIGRASNVGVVSGRLMGDIEFATPETYEFADTVFQLVKGGFLKAVSVGFLAKDWRFTSDKNRPNGLDFLKQMLCEISICAIPANPHALIAARASGIDTRALRSWAERVLDEGTSPTPRRDLEALRSQAAEPRRARVVRSAGGDMLNDCVDGLNAAIGDHRQMRDNLRAMANDGDPAGHVGHAAGHVDEACARLSKAVSCLRDAAAVSGDPPHAAMQDAAPSLRNKGHDLTTVSGRIAHAAEVREIIERQEAARKITSEAQRHLR